MAYTVLAGVAIAIIKHRPHSTPCEIDVGRIDSITNTDFFRVLNHFLARLPIQLGFRDPASRMSVIVDVSDLAITLVLAFLVYMVASEVRMVARTRGRRA